MLKIAGKLTKKIFSWFFLALCLSLIIGLSKDIIRLLKADERIKNQESKLLALKKENQRLKEKQEYYQSDQFKEEQIRNKLQMAKSGETIVILPEEIASGEADKFNKDDRKDKGEEMSNWQKWLGLFW